MSQSVGSSERRKTTRSMNSRRWNSARVHRAKVRAILTLLAKRSNIPDYSDGLCWHFFALEHLDLAAHIAHGDGGKWRR
jgi:hypothetical protein